MWSQPAMASRSLTSPAGQGDYAVVGDFDGYLHWLKLDTGELAARTRVSRDALRAAPIVVDGQVAAFQVGVLAGDAAGVDQYERPLLDQPADAVVAVAGDAGLVVHERIAEIGRAHV